MVHSCVVPVPVLFNCLKHHLGFIKEYIHASSEAKNTGELTDQLLFIGESQMDLYVGKLEPASIADQISEQLQKKGVFEKADYVNFLHLQGSGYQTLTILDTSMWILRLGKLEGRYIHIHPGRYSPHTVRVKASTLKTAIALSVWMKLHGYTEATIELLNYVRKDILDASPMKSLAAAEGFGKVFKLIHANT